jgi:hypothetical protein
MVIDRVNMMSLTLLADIGGSKSRFALANSAGRPERILIMDNDTVADLDGAVSRYLDETGARPRAPCTTPPPSPPLRRWPSPVPSMARRSRSPTGHGGSGVPSWRSGSDGRSSAS